MAESTAIPVPSDDRENTFRLLMDVFRDWQTTVPDGPDGPELVRRFGVVAALAAAEVLDDDLRSPAEWSEVLE